jgi:hypothetical protein
MSTAYSISSSSLDRPIGTVARPVAIDIATGEQSMPPCHELATGGL